MRALSAAYALACVADGLRPATVVPWRSTAALFGRWAQPSCQAGFNRSSQRTHEAPRTMEDWVRLGAAERKRVRKLRAKGLYDGPEVMTDAVAVLPSDVEDTHLDTRGRA